MHQPYDILYTDSVNSPLHWHYYSEILYIISGSIRVVCNNKEKILYKGDVCYFYPLQLHEVMPHADCTENGRHTVKIESCKVTPVNAEEKREQH